MKDFFKSQKEFESAIGWIEKEKKIQHQFLYLAVNHQAKKQCVLFSETHQQLTGVESGWICR